MTSLLVVEIWGMVFERCSVETRKAFFELNSFFHSLCCEYIWEKIIFEEKWLNARDFNLKLELGLEREATIPFQYIFRIFESFLNNEFSYFLNERICLNYVVKFSTSKWLMENKEKICNIFKKNNDSNDERDNDESRSVDVNVFKDFLTNHGLEEYKEKMEEKEKKRKNNNNNNNNNYFKEMILKATTTYWGRIRFLMFLWMEGCLELSWDELRLKNRGEENSVYDKICESGEVYYFQFLRKTFGNDLFNKEFILKEKTIGLISRNGNIEILKYLKEEFDLYKEDFLLAGENDFLKETCMNGNLHVLKYFKQQFGLEKEDICVEKNVALRMSCKFGHLPIVKFLKQEYGLKRKDIIMEDNYALRGTCEYGNFEMLKYLKEEFKLEKEDVQEDENYVLKSCCISGKIEFVKYLKEEFGLDKEDVRSNNNISLKWAVR